MSLSVSEVTEVFGKIILQDCGPDDNFFDIGGDSLLAEALAMELSERAQRDIPISALLDYPTPRELAGHIAGLPAY